MTTARQAGEGGREFDPAILFVKATSYRERLKPQKIVTELARGNKDGTFKRAFRKVFGQG